MSTPTGLEHFNAKMEFSLELLHKVLGGEETSETLQLAIDKQIVSEEILEKVKNMVTAVTSTEDDESKMQKITALRDYLFILLD